EFGDGPAELLALLRVSERLFEGALRDAERDGAGAHALRVVRAHQSREALAQAPGRYEQRARRDVQVAEMDVRLGNAAHAHRRNPLADHEALGLGAVAHDDESADALLHAAVEDAREDEMELRDAPAGDPVLVAVEHVGIPTAIGARRHLGGDAYVLNGDK